MKTIIFAVLASLLSAVFGSALLALCFQRIELFKSILVVAVPVCMVVGMTVVGPLSAAVKAHGYLFATVSGLVAGGLIGGGIIVLVYYFSPQRNLSTEFWTAFAFWVLIGAVFGMIYVTGLKSFLTFFINTKKL